VGSQKKVLHNNRMPAPWSSRGRHQTTGAPLKIDFARSSSEFLTLCGFPDARAPSPALVRFHHHSEKRPTRDSFAASAASICISSLSDLGPSDPQRATLPSIAAPPQKWPRLRSRRFWRAPTQTSRADRECPNSPPRPSIHRTAFRLSQISTRNGQTGSNVPFLCLPSLLGRAG
jgi:hypothetical protein